MAELTDIESAITERLRAQYRQTILAELQDANAQVPEFINDNQYKQGFISALDTMVNSEEFTALCIGETTQLLTTAIEALPEQTKIDLGIDHLF